MPLKNVPVPGKALQDYRHVVGDEILEEIKSLAQQLRGARILHLNATAYGGGVAELLYSMISLKRDLGLHAEWRIMEGNEEFFTITKYIHNGLQGMEVPWTTKMKEAYLQINQENAKQLDGDFDYYIIHDPQPLAMKNFYQRLFPEKKGKWVWRCHIDPSPAKEEIWDFLHPFVEEYQNAVVTMDQYRKDLKVDTTIMPPCIDPLSPKNITLAPETVSAVVEQFGIDIKRPLLTQVSRYDPWKDPMGVIDAYRTVKKEFPDLQLALVASMAHDDPEGWHYYEKTARKAGEDYDIHLFTNLQGVGNLEVNAFQQASDIVIQKSLREGFGLVVAEALWKHRPVVGGNVGGIKLQIQNGESGYLVDSVDECAQRLSELVKNPEKAKQMGARGHDFVKNNFLVTRELRDWLRLLLSL